MKDSRSVNVSILLAALILALAVATPVIAQTPQLITYQGQLLDSTGSLVADGPYAVLFQIYDDPFAGTVMWSSGIRQLEVAGGLMTYLLGDTVPLPHDLFANDTGLWLGVTVNPDPEMTPRQRLTTNAYAYHALRTDSAGIAEMVKDDAITSAMIVDGTIVTADLADNAVTSAKIADGTVGQNDINSGQVQRRVTQSCGDGSSISYIYEDGSVICEPDDNTTYSSGSGLQLLGTTFSVPTGGITSSHIADATVSAADLATNSVQAAEIASGAVGSSEIASNAVGSDEIASNAVGSSEIADGTVGTAEIATNGVGSSEIASSAVGTSEIANSSIVNADISGSAAIDVSKISGTAVNLSSSQYITGQKNFGDSAMRVSPSGVRIGDNGAISSSYLIYATRQFNTTTARYGVYVKAEQASTGQTYGVRGSATGITEGAGGVVYGVQGTGASDGSSRYGVRGIAQTQNPTLTTGNTYALRGSAYDGATAYGVYGWAGEANTNWAGYFSGNINVTGSVVKAASGFRTDHPLDPENKYLQHASVESPDMMNIYNGNVSLDADGAATVQLPDYFNSVNRDFRYQLTPIGAAMPNLHVAERLSGNLFRIGGGSAFGEVSWQMTGVRKDKWAEANRIQVEPDKLEHEAGYYMHYKEWDQPMEKSIDREQLLEDKELRESNSDTD